MKKFKKFLFIIPILTLLIFGNLGYAQETHKREAIGGDLKTNGNNIPTPKIDLPNTSSSTTDSAGLKLDCFRGNGRCGINIYETLGIKNSNKKGNVETFAQDLILSSTIFFGTILGLVILVSGILYIVSGIQGSDSLQTKAKKGLIGGIIGLVLVSGSFAIVRFVQFLAQGHS